MADFARRVTLEVSIDGYDVAGAFAPYLLDFTFTDNASGKSDDLQVTLHNSDGKFSGDWRPKKGMEIQAAIVCHDWESQGEDLKLPCGAFTIDEVELSGPPDKIRIKAVSASLAGGLRDTKKTRAWENISLKTLAGQIAGDNSLTLMYYGEDHRFERQDQRNESDISFLARLAGDFGMKCKAHDGKLILFGSEEAEKEDAIIEIPKTGGMYSPKSYSFKMSSSGTDYDKAQVAYTDPKTGKTQTAEARSAKNSAKKSGSEKVLTVNQRVENPDQAQKLARAKLHRENRKEQTASLECMGNPALVAGRNVELTGFEEFSGKWCVKSASHKISGSGGYSTSLELSAPAPTKPGKTESFVSERGAGESNVKEKYPKTFVDLQKAVEKSKNIIFKTIMCVPSIAYVISERLRLENKEQDALGWQFLGDLLDKWIVHQENRQADSLEPYWIDWCWAIQYFKLLAAYNEFINKDLQEGTIYAPLAMKSLSKILCKSKLLNPEYQVIDFNFINSDWRTWKDNYYTLKIVPYEFADADLNGLYAALGAFSLRALAQGKVINNGAGKWKLVLEKAGIFIHDIFNFEAGIPGTQDYLGAWKCDGKNSGFSKVGAGGYIGLDNGDFRDFREKFHWGGDFLVLSKPYLVENIKQVSYDFVCSN